jgi:hypothetical protein
MKIQQIILIILVSLSIEMSLLLIHNIDNAFNLIKIERDLCFQGSYYEFCDSNLLGNCMRPEKFYAMSMFFLIIFTIPFLFGFLFIIIKGGDEDGGKRYSRSAW